ncbi:MAG: DUF6765 family protein [Vulcanimicrobiota bacterium]
MLILQMAASALAYDLDTHYAFTYYLARKVGFTARQARSIASADSSIDTDPSTEPLQIDQVVNPLGDAQGPRIRFHALPPSALNVDSDPEAQKKRNQFNQQRLEQLWQQGLAQHNPGIYLHYLQDTFAHRGYYSTSGHAGAGHAKDYLSVNEHDSIEMMEATIKALQRFMREDLKREPCDPDRQECLAVLHQLVQVNQPPSCLGTYFSSPDLPKASQQVSTALGGENFPEAVEYHYDKEHQTLSVAPVGDALVPELLMGKWVRVQSQDGPKAPDLPDCLRFYYDGSKIDAQGTCSWQGETYDDQARTANFVRKPSLEESGLAESWVYFAIEHDIRWKLRLKFRCPLEIQVDFMPGVAEWRKVFDGDTGYLKEKKAWVSGEGRPRSFYYRWQPDTTPSK